MKSLFNQTHTEIMKNFKRTKTPSLLLASLLTSFGLSTLTSSAHAVGLGARARSEIPPIIISEIRKKFEAHAKPRDSNGPLVLDFSGFLEATRSLGGSVASDKQKKILFSLADQDKDQFLTFDEFFEFELVMTGPEADYKIAFELFDSNRNGVITLNEFKSVLQTTRFSRDIEFNLDCEWVRSFFGKDGSSSINYNEFTQLLKGLDSEVLRQAFLSRAKEVNGQFSISSDDLQHILLSSFSERIIGEIPNEIRNNFANIPSSKSVTFSDFMALYNVLMNLDRVKEGIIQASEHKRHPQITRSEFLRVTRRLKLFEFTPLESEIVYKIFDVDKDGLISLKDYTRLFPVIPQNHHPAAQRKTGYMRLKESIVNFMLGSVAGAIGAAAVYPIDLVKTRMQNQRFTSESEKVYKNSWDCFKKVLFGEGFLGLYRGLGPQLIGVAPEKAIKLTVNDFLRDLFGKPGGDIYLPLEILAGGCAGASQVIFTNPIEIVKIRLQVQGENIKYGIAKKSTATIIKELGFRGLYRGAPACLLRDIPFSAIYFPAYAKFKVELCDPKKQAKDWNLLLAGALAGIPAASLVTPADVIKTRLQVEARSGQQTYKNIPHCAATIWKTEGFRAFWKGAGMRVFRSSPQFGVTLWSYEKLRYWLAPDMVRPNPPTNAPVHSVDYDRMVRGGVDRSLRRTDQRWGLFGDNKEN